MDWLSITGLFLIFVVVVVLIVIFDAVFTTKMTFKKVTFVEIVIVASILGLIVGTYLMNTTGWSAAGTYILAGVILLLIPIYHLLKYAWSA